MQEIIPLKESVALIAAVIAVIGNIPYLRDAIRKRIEPHPYTWLVWTIVSGIVFFGQLAKGAGWGVIPTGAAEIFTLIIFIYSLRYGFRNIRRADTYFLIIALLGIIPWILTDDPTISVIIAVSIDTVAFMPTLRKTWRAPHTETVALYSMNVVRHALTLISLSSYNIATTLHSIVMIIINSIMTWILITKREKPELSSHH